MNSPHPLQALAPRALAAWLLPVLMALPARGTELVYIPVNPTFGGNPANASGLQGNAASQNQYTNPKTAKTVPKTALEKFTAQLESAVLNRLTVTAVNSLFDADGKLLPNRTITAGNYVIAITLEDGNLVMTTTDNSNPGTSTRIVVGNAPTP